MATLNSRSDSTNSTTIASKPITVHIPSRITEGIKLNQAVFQTESNSTFNSQSQPATVNGLDISYTYVSVINDLPINTTETVITVTSQEQSSLQFVIRELSSYDNVRYITQIISTDNAQVVAQSTKAQNNIFTTSMPYLNGTIQLSMQIDTDAIFSNVVVSYTQSTSLDSTTVNDNGTTTLQEQSSEYAVITCNYVLAPYGADIATTVCTVFGKKLYQIQYQYPKPLLGILNWTDLIEIPGKEYSYFQFTTNFVQVMRGQGETGWERAEDTKMLFSKLCSNDEFARTSNIIQFFTELNNYMVVRYYLSGLTSREFNIKWLLGKYNDKFLHNLANSDFSNQLSKFTVGKYKDFNKYMRYSFNKSTPCDNTD
jgi:hypothetical protein